MHPLHHLVHSLAKEEKRIYNVYGQKSKFGEIYKEYQKMPEFRKKTDQAIYAKFFSKFTKAYYSIRKRELFEDILFVLMRYAKPKNSEFQLSRFFGLYFTLKNRGYFDLAYEYLLALLNVSEQLNNLEFRFFLFNEFKNLVQKLKEAPLFEIEKILGQQEMLKKELAQRRMLTDFSLDVLIAKQANDASQFDILIKKHAEVSELLPKNPLINEELFLIKLKIHQFLLEKAEIHEFLKNSLDQFECEKFAGFPDEFSWKFWQIFLRSAIKNGDFINFESLIYKIQRILDSDFTQNIPQNYLNEILVLFGIYFFYEEEYYEAEKYFNQFVASRPKENFRIKMLQVKLMIASNQHLSAKKLIEEVESEFEIKKSDVDFYLTKLICLWESCNRDDVLDEINRVVHFFQKEKFDKRFPDEYRFLRAFSAYSEGKAVNFSKLKDDKDWLQMMKYKLWLKSKIKKKFYHDYIGESWREMKNMR